MAEEDLDLDKIFQFKTNSIKEECFCFFDSDSKGFLNNVDFFYILASLVTDKTKLTLTDSNELFECFDVNKDDKIDSIEFENMWNNWIIKLLNPKFALLIIDVQNDFIDGTLAMRNCTAKQEAKEIIPMINNLIQKFNFDAIVFSLDFHPENHISFINNVHYYKLQEKNNSKIQLFDIVTFAGPPVMKQKLWPRHCVRNTWGSQLDPGLRVPKNSIMVLKGTQPNIDSYSAFYDNMKLSKTSLDAKLQQKHISHLFVCGIAYDYCVSYTALDALDLGYPTIIIKDASPGTDEINIENMTKTLLDKSAVIANSTDLDKFVEGKNIKLEFARVMAKHHS